MSCPRAWTRNLHLLPLLLLLILLSVTACETATVPPTPFARLEATSSPSKSPSPSSLASADPCSLTALPSNIKALTLAEDVSGAALEPVNATEIFSPMQPRFHAIIAVENAPASTKLRAVWYLLEAKGYTSNTEIDTTERVINGSGNFDFTLAPSSGAWPVGSYCLLIYADDHLAISKRFSVQGAPALQGSPIVEVTFAEDVDPNTFAPVNPARSFGAAISTIHCIVQVQDAAPDTAFVARWLLPSGIATDWQLTTQGSRRLDFALRPAAAPFPVGAHKVELYVNGKLDRTESFNVF